MAEDDTSHIEYCFECGKELNKNNIGKSKVFACEDRKFRICEKCYYSIVQSYLRGRISRLKSSNDMSR